MNPNGSLIVDKNCELLRDDFHLPLANGYSYLPLYGDLFSREPSLSDISQGKIGDCYLLAALQAIVLRQPEYIYNMMLCIDNYVWVRFFYGRTSYIIRVQKTIFKANKFNLIEQENNAPWVQMIEKSYA
ncbi:MAG: hypothetical protein K5Q00_04355, partial [Gammaproteobacteria bacterium]|nr:hypothetical protein [Gammaproteobacteria bacterium]